MTTVKFRAKNIFDEIVEGTGFTMVGDNGKIVIGEKEIDLSLLGFIFEKGMVLMDDSEFYNRGDWHYVYIDTLETFIKNY